MNTGTQSTSAQNWDGSVEHTLENVIVSIASQPLPSNVRQLRVPRQSVRQSSRLESTVELTANLPQVSLDITASERLHDDKHSGDSNQDIGKLYSRFLQISRTADVVGYLVLGFDGLPILSTLPQDCDADYWAAWGLMTYMSLKQAGERLGSDHALQSVSRVERGIVLLQITDVGLLVVISDGTESGNVLDLIDVAQRC